jgi:nucleotide-binding universal stress UspA family protein
VAETRKIVVGYDGSEPARRAIEVAFNLAGEDDRVTIVTAYHLPPEIKSYEFFEDLAAVFKQAAEELLGSAREIVPEHRPDVHYQVVEGGAADALADFARKSGADLLVVGCMGAGPVRSMIGSVTHKLLHVTPCPVIVVPKTL